MLVFEVDIAGVGVAVDISCKDRMPIRDCGAV